MSEKMKLNDELTVEAYPFSDYITCVEVNMNGNSYQSFCTLKSQVDEWKEDMDLFADICYEHVKKFSGAITPQKRLTLSNGLEVEIYPFSDYIYCVDVFNGDQMVQSFCCDTNTFTEYQDDMESMLALYGRIS
jgi:hypothetical protein